MTANVAIFTICSNNYLPFARVFFASVKAQHPEADLYLCLADRPAGGGVPPAADWQVVAAGDLGMDDFSSLAFSYAIKEFNTALKPFMFLHLLETKRYDTVVYFDPDVQLYRPLIEELEALRGGASVSLTPHILQPLETAEAPDDITIMRTGIYNLGFLGASRREETLELMRWWARRLRFQCLDAQPEGLFVDQKFMDLAPAFAPHCRIARNPGLNVAYWNLSQRTVAQSETGWTANGVPLVFFHFSGFDPARPARLSCYTTRFRATLSPALRQLMADYAQRLLENGFGTERSLPYAYDAFASGAPIHPYVRRMFREWTPHWAEDPFETYEAYLHSPWPDAAHESPAFVVTNFMAFLWHTMPGLKPRFDLKRPADVRAFVTWYALRASADLELDDTMVAPVLRRIAQHGITLEDQPLPEAAVELPMTENNLLLLEGLQRLRHRLAPAGSRREDMLRAVYQFMLKRIANRSAAARAAEAARSRTGSGQAQRKAGNTFGGTGGVLKKAPVSPN
jgi:hypothetical protein